MTIYLNRTYTELAYSDDRRIVLAMLWYRSDAMEYVVSNEMNASSERFSDLVKAREAFEEQIKINSEAITRGPTK